MPAGLDGNPNPLVTPARSRVLAAAAEQILQASAPSGRTCVAVDGRSGSGKSTFANELGARLREEGVTTLRSTTDSFHRPRSERLRRGPSSPEGYVEDSHQIEAIVDDLLVPFANGADRVCVGRFDEPRDQPAVQWATVNGPTVLIFDGLFLQRSELESHWDVVIFLEADTRLDGRWLEFLLADLPTEPSNQAALIDERLAQARWPRYRRGWDRYQSTTRPREQAHLVIDNNNLAEPFLVDDGG